MASYSPRDEHPPAGQASVSNGWLPLTFIPRLCPQEHLAWQVSIVAWKIQHLITPLMPVLTGFFANLTQARVIWEERTSMEKMPLLD